MNRTTIEWCRNPDDTPGYTWNPITGCLGGCSYCYARKLANGRLRERYLANTRVTQHHTGAVQGLQDPFYPRFWPEKLFHDMGTNPKGIFVCNMGDLFGIGVPEDWTSRILKAAEYRPRNRYYLLTKQPQNLAKFSPFPDNCWVGFTATDDDMWLKGMHHMINYISAKVKFVSFEPLEGEILTGRRGMVTDAFEYIDWIIIGAQTKPTVYPKRVWVDEIIEAAKSAGVPYFLKDNLKPIMGDNLVQDMPK